MSGNGWYLCSYTFLSLLAVDKKYINLNKAAVMGSSTLRCTLEVFNVLHWGQYLELVIVENLTPEEQVYATLKHETICCIPDALIDIIKYDLRRLGYEPTTCGAITQ